MSTALFPALSSGRKSTNVRAEMRQELATRWFSVLSRWAPPAAVWWAERRFRTPPHFAAPAAERQALATARRFYVPFGRVELTAWFWPGRGPTVLVVHGWGGRAGQLAPVAQSLLWHGFSVVGFDAPAHGESSGSHTDLMEFADAIEAVVRACGPMAGTVAHSMGGAAAALAQNRGAALGRLILVGSPSEPLAQTHRFAAALRLPEAVRSGLQRRVERRLGRSFAALDLAQQPTPGVPVLVVHDRRDPEIPFEEGRKLAERWGARLVATDGLGHRRILRDAGVHEEIGRFLLADPEIARTFVRKSCATPGCANLAAHGADVWPEWAGYCPTCALELDLRHRSPSKPPTV
jgi:pimeloyl-ACP methyl ester carboxylesterase